MPCSTSYGIFILTAFGILERVQSFNSVAPEAFPPRVPFQRARSALQGLRGIRRDPYIEGTLNLIPLSPINAEFSPLHT